MKSLGHWQVKRRLQGLRHRSRQTIGLRRRGPSSNMQWQTVADAKAKDKWERKQCGK
jgi:hypothetical protein